MSRDVRTLAGTAGLGLLMVACCTAPALVAAGTLGVIAGAARNPYVIAAAAGLAALLIVVAVACLIRHRRHGDTGGCCTPTAAGSAEPTSSTEPTDSAEPTALTGGPRIGSARDRGDISGGAR